MKPSPLITDPKAGEYPGFSPYANRGCNPTRFLDPSGGVIIHIPKMFQAGLYYYSDDPPETDSDLIHDQYSWGDPIESGYDPAINYIRQTLYGRAVYDYLNNSSTKIYVAETSGHNHYSVDNHTIYWNPQKDVVGQYLVDGMLCRTGPAFIGLFHEMMHGADHVNGTIDGRTWVRYGDNEIVPISEKTACIGENFFRAEIEMPARLYYGINEGNPIINLNSNDSFKTLPNFPFFLKVLSSLYQCAFMPKPSNL